MSTGATQSSSGSQKIYTMTFVESGLPPWKSWSVTVDDAHQCAYASTRSLIFTTSEPGPHYYTVRATCPHVTPVITVAPGAESLRASTAAPEDTYYVPSVVNGALTVDDSHPSAVIPIQFYPTNIPNPTSTGTVTFNMSGMPSDFPWEVIIGEGTQWHHLSGKGNQSVSITLPSPGLYEFDFESAANCSAINISTGYVLLTDEKPNVTVDLQCLQFVEHLGLFWYKVAVVAAAVVGATVLLVGMLSGPRQRGSRSSGGAAAQSPGHLGRRGENL